jgi:hypothetical protein
VSDSQMPTFGSNRPGPAMPWQFDGSSDEEN